MVQYLPNYILPMLSDELILNLGVQYMNLRYVWLRVLHAHHVIFNLRGQI